MRVGVDVMSNATPLINRLREAQAKGLTAAAQVTQNAVKRALRHGYHSSLGNWGHFTTGNNVDHVTKSPVEFTGDGASIKVGTDLLYALYWEVGHHNIFTRHFERDEKWAPAYGESRQQALDAYQRVFSRTWKGDTGMTLGDSGIAAWISGAGRDETEE
jgi:hypothetical protein